MVGVTRCELSVKGIEAHAVADHRVLFCALHKAVHRGQDSRIFHAAIVRGPHHKLEYIVGAPAVLDGFVISYHLMRIGQVPQGEGIYLESLHTRTDHHGDGRRHGPCHRARSLDQAATSIGKRIDIPMRGECHLVGNQHEGNGH